MCIYIYIFICCCLALSHVQLFCDAMDCRVLSMGFPMQEYWSGLPFPSPGDHPNPGIEPMSPTLAGGFVTTQPRESESESHSVLLDSLWPHGLSDQISCSVVSDSLRPHESQHARPWNSPGQRTGVGSHSLLQGIFATQILNPGLLHCRQILYQLSLGRHRILVSCFFT